MSTILCPAGGVIPPNGIVSLLDKQSPSCDKKELDTDYAFTRAVLDVSAFKDMLQKLPAEMWEDEKQQGNVKIHRPAHDAWGIKKIVFTFCDDFLLKVFDLPWSQAEEWRCHLLPIYSALGIKENQVVRSLLASMPPGMSIPVHHDTGYWVKHTHRCHVAIVTDTYEVDFFCGSTNETLRKMSFSEGRLIELNNSAKHAVTNKMKDTWRIHLILDYVDEHPVNRYLLAPGDKLNQTRRSIDLAKDQGSRPAPSFIIIGAQKSGTTSLYELMCQHPLVIKGGRRETHCFDWRWDEALKTVEEQKAHYMKFFNTEALFKYPSLLTGESTPSYLLHSDIVIPRFLAVSPLAKVLVMLRNPVDRAYSQYQMCLDPKGTPEQIKVRGMSAYAGRTFEDIIKEEIEEISFFGITAESSSADFKNLFLSTRANIKHGGHSIIARGLYVLQLQPWLDVLKPDQLLVLSIGELKSEKSDVQRYIIYL